MGRKKRFTWTKQDKLKYYDPDDPDKEISKATFRKKTRENAGIESKLKEK